MSDVGLVWQNGKADVLLNSDGNDLQSGHELQTAILVSLFTDARAAVTDVPDINSDRRGWWAANLGSLLWLLARAKTTQVNLQNGISYIKNALSWLTAKGIADRVDVTGMIENLYKFTFTIKIRRSASAKYDYLWDGLEVELYDFDKSSYLIVFE